MKKRVLRMVMAIVSLLFILNSGFVEETAYVHASNMKKATRATDQTSTDQNRLPATVDDYLANKKSVYYIQDWSDFIKVQDFCTKKELLFNSSFVH